MKRILALLLALTLVMGVMGVSAFAADAATTSTVPKIGAMTVDGENVSLKVEGENISEVEVLFRSETAGYGWWTYLYPDENEAGTFTGTNWHSYPDATITEYEVYQNGKATTTTSSDKKTETTNQTNKTFYYDSDKKLTEYSSEKNISTYHYQDVTRKIKQDGQTVSENAHELTDWSSEYTRTRFNKDGKQTSVTTGKDASTYEYVENEYSTGWSYYQQQRKSRTESSNTKEYSPATGNLTSDDTTETVYNYKDGNYKGRKETRKDLEYFNNVKFRDYTTEVEYDENWNPVQEKREGESYYKLTGHLKEKASSETTEKEEKDKEGKIIKETDTYKAETKNYRDLNQTGESTQDRTTVYDYKNGYENYEVSVTSKTTGKNYNQYSGKLLSTTEGSSSSKKVYKDYDLDSEKSSSSSTTKDTAGKVIASSTEEKTTTTTKTDKGETITTTIKTTGYDEETGNTSSQRVSTTSYNTNGTRLSSSETYEEKHGSQIVVSSENTETRRVWDSATGKYTTNTPQSKSSEKRYDAKTGNVISGNSNSTVNTYDDNGNRTKYTYEYSNESGDAETGKTTYKYSNKKTEEYNATSHDTEKSTSESITENFDKDTGKKTYYHTESTTKDTTSVKQINETRNYNKDTGAEVSGSKTETTEKRDGYYGSTEERKTVTTSTGKGGKTISTSTKNETWKNGYEYTLNTEAYDSDTFELLYTSSEEQKRDTEKGSTLYTYEKKNASKAVIETKKTEYNPYEYDKKDPAEATKRTRKNVSSTKKYDEETGKQLISSSDIENTYYEKKNEDGNWEDEDIYRINTNVTKNASGTSKTKYEYGKQKTKEGEYDEKTKTQTTTSEQTTTTTSESYDKKDNLKNKIVTTTVEESKTVRTYKENEDSSRELESTHTTTSYTTTNANESNHRTTVSKSTTDTTNIVGKGETEKVETQETTINNIKTSSYKSTTTKTDTREVDKDGKPKTTDAAYTTKTVTENFSATSGTNKTEKEESSDYTWNADTKSWKYIGSTSKSKTTKDGEVTDSRTEVYRTDTKAKEASDKLSKTTTETRETTVTDADQKETVTKATTVNNYTRKTKDDSYERTSGSSKTEKNGVVTYQSEDSHKTDTNAKTQITTQTDKSSTKDNYLNGKPKVVTTNESVNVQNDGEINIGDYEVPSWDQGRDTEKDSTTRKYYWKNQLTYEEKTEDSNQYDFKAMTGQAESSESVKTYDKLTGKTTSTRDEKRVRNYQYTADDFHDDANYYYWDQTGSKTTVTEKTYEKGKLSSDSQSTEETTKADRKETTTYNKVTKEYNRAGKETGKTETSRVNNYARSAYSGNYLPNGSTYTEKEWQNGILVRDEKKTTVNTYTDESRTDVTTTETIQNNDQTGALKAKTTYTYTEKSDRKIDTWGENFSMVESTNNSKTVNKNNVAISTSSYSSVVKEDKEKDETTTTVESKNETFDYLGNRTGGSSSQYVIDGYEGPGNVNYLSRHEEGYSRYGLNWTRDYEYDAETGKQIKTTETYYNNHKNGKSVKSSEYVSTPEKMKNDQGYETSRILNHTKETSYDRYGGVTQIVTVDEAYDEKSASTTETKTTIDYRGVNEQRTKTVEETVVGKRGYDNYSTETTTVYNWENKVKSKEIHSRESDKETPVYEWTYESGVDANGYNYSKSSTKEKGVLVSSSVMEYSQKDKTQVTTYSKYDSISGKLIGSTVSSGSYSNAGTYISTEKNLDKNGKLIYTVSSVTEIGKNKSTVYTDANGKEIGYRKIGANGAVSYKTPEFDENRYELTGAWTEYTETVNKKGETTAESTKKYDKEGKLASTDVYKDEVRTETYYQNPDNKLSKVVVTPDDVRNDEDYVTESKSTTTWYQLDGKQDRAEVKTTKYEYDEYAGETYNGPDGSEETFGWVKATTTTEYLDANNKAVVTKTVVDDSYDYTKDSTTITKADGTKIGYKRYTSDGDVYEALVPEFNPYTGYVYEQTATVTKNNADGSYEKTSKRTNDKGFVLEESVVQRDKDQNEKETVKTYNNDGKIEKIYNSTFDQKTLKTQTTTENYRETGTVAYTVNSETTYDAKRDLWVTKTEQYNTDKELVFTTESTRDTVFEGTYGPGSVSGSVTITNATTKDTDGNEIGYRKTDAKGNVTVKSPDTYAWNGELTGGWTERTTYYGDTGYTTKSYDKDGWLTYEAAGKEDEESSKAYWKQSAQVKTAWTSKTDNTGMTTENKTVYNEDGSVRNSEVTVSGRKTGTHFWTETTSHYGSNGQLLYTYEYQDDLQKDEQTGVYKNAAGKEIGYDRREADDGSWKQLIPFSDAPRTGKITGFVEEGADKNGFNYSKTYDANMKLQESYIEGRNEEGYKTSSWYYKNNKKPYSVTTSYSGETEYATFNKAGEKVATDVSKGYSNSLVNSETKHYNQKGELIYSTLNMRDLNRENGWTGYTVYLDAKGKEIGRSQTKDNGEYSSKYPETTYANNITGYHEYIESADGKIVITRGYDKNNKLIGETYRKDDVVKTDEKYTYTTSKKDGTVLNTVEDELDKNGEVTKSTITTFSRWNGARTETFKQYYNDSGDVAWKSIDKNGNETYYGWSWRNNDYNYSESYWVNGVMQTYHWDDDQEDSSEEIRNEDGSHTEAYNADGTYRYWRDDDGNGHIQTWWYDRNGVLLAYAEETNGVTNITYYGKDGSITGYDWGSKSSDDNVTGGMDTTIWNASIEMYKLHIEDDPEAAGTIETWKDATNNVKTVKRDRYGETTETKVELASKTDGWQLAFGDEWYYVEGGKPVTGWKAVGGAWYYFEDGGAMATGVVKDGEALYAMDKNGTWTAEGWNQDENGDWQFVDANGQAATGWRLVGGKWYYFDDGWYIDDSGYDTQVGWKQRDGGTMVTGAAQIWNDSWSDQVTYFFNADGSWDTSAGWKSDGIDWYYFNDGGSRTTGWRKIDGTWYYFNDKGVMRNGWVGDPSGWYYMNANGSMADGQWIQEKFEDTWYYADKGGLMATGWRQINGEWYYFNPSGEMASKQWVRSGDSWYYQTETGEMATGWVQDEGSWYYMGTSGAMQTGWVSDGGVWYYMDGSGVMQTGEVTIDGVVNVFDASGAWLGTK